MREFCGKKSCLIVGEVAQSHEGSLGMAHAYIDALARAGADAVKFQTHIAAAESTQKEPWRVKFSYQDATRYDYWKRMEFTAGQWAGLKKHAGDRGLLFVSSPFSMEAVELLKEISIDLWKVASGEVGNVPMFEAMAGTGLPVLISTGMSPFAEIDRAVEVFKSHRSPLAVLQCTSKYPCPPEKIGLNLIPLFKERYQCRVGLSDHSGVIYTGMAAAAMGIDVLEVHVILSREMFGPDVSVSLTTAELAQLVEGVRFIEKMRENPVDKDEMAEENREMRELFTKSIVARSALKRGTVLEPQHLAVKKPGLGLPAARLSDVIGRRLERDLAADEFIHEQDLEAKSESKPCEKSVSS